MSFWRRRNVTKAQAKTRKNTAAQEAAVVHIQRSVKNISEQFAASLENLDEAITSMTESRNSEGSPHG